MDHAGCSVEESRPVRGMRYNYSLPSLKDDYTFSLYCHLMCSVGGVSLPSHSPPSSIHPIVNIGPCNWLWFNGMCTDMTYQNPYIRLDCKFQLSPLVLLSAMRITDGGSSFRLDPGMKRHVKKSHSLYQIFISYITWEKCMFVIISY